jgi:DNA-directed RNA polymerase subunit RPC12/RpoP
MNYTCEQCWSNIEQDRVNLNLNTCFECATKISKAREQQIKMHKLNKISEIEPEEMDVNSIDKVLTL